MELNLLKTVIADAPLLAAAFAETDIERNVSLVDHYLCCYDRFLDVRRRHILLVSGFLSLYLKKTHSALTGILRQNSSVARKGERGLVMNFKTL